MTAPTANSAGNLGLSLMFAEAGDSNFAIGIDRIFSRWEMGLNTYFRHTPSQSLDHWNFGAYLGYIIPAQGKVNFSFGLAGNIVLESNSSDAEYDTGAYIGIAFNPNTHYRIFTRVNAVDYEHYGSNDSWRFFSEGKIGVTYFF